MRIEFLHGVPPLFKLIAMYKSGIFYLVLCCHWVVAQNELDTNTWTIGSGSVTGFVQNGTTAENSREYGRNHLGEQVLLWQATPDAGSDADGGWNSDYHLIDPSQSYRFSVWIRKTNSASGITYFGFDEPSGLLFSLDGLPNATPYFWSGDLPRLDRWYLLVGFVHGSNTDVTTHSGRMYDGVTGAVVEELTDFKCAIKATALRHRAFLNYDTNTEDRQYFYAPRLEPVNTRIPDIETLLGVQPNASVVFSYDSAGNQMLVSYQSDLLTDEQLSSNLTLADTFSEVYLFPNPTSGTIYMEWKKAIEAYVKSVRLTYLVDMTAVRLNYQLEKNNMAIDMRHLVTGVYAVRIDFTDGSYLTKEIIKI